MTSEKPDTQTEEAAGREVFVTKDESGITSLSEDEKGADPTVGRDEDDDAAAEAGDASAEGGDSDGEGG